jgi:tRNA threonylcarbamoyladenosine biosynthesis protein TsaB
MIILGIDTATAQVGCAVGGAEGALASFHASRGRRHAETLAPAIEFVCRQARIELAEVATVAVDIGPGLFTGLRVGLATAKAMASSLRVPMVGLTSLDLLAYPERRSGRLIAAMVDARRGEVFWALYRHVPGGVQRLTPYAVSPPAEVASELMARGDDCLAVGDGARRYAGLLDEVTHVEVGTSGSAYPSAAVLVELAHPLAVREQFVVPAELGPLYLRKADVRIHWETRDAHLVHDELAGRGDAGWMGR